MRMYRLFKVTWYFSFVLSQLFISHIAIINDVSLVHALLVKLHHVKDIENKRYWHLLTNYLFIRRYVQEQSSSRIAANFPINETVIIKFNQIAASVPDYYRKLTVALKTTYADYYRKYLPEDEPNEYETERGSNSSVYCNTNQ
jgi:hypothetical protein